MQQDYKFHRNVATTFLLAAVCSLSLYFFLSLDVTHLWIAKVVHAAATFNDDPQDFATLRVANFTKYPNSTTNWVTNLSGVDTPNAGDIVSVTIYYHNTSAEDAQNVRATVAVPNTAGISIVASGGLSADNASSVSGQATINISSSQSLTYIPGSTKWFPNQSVTSTPFPAGQTGDEFVTPQGVNIGTIAAAANFATQGSIVAHFQVSNTVTPTGTATSTVDITANGSQGPLQLSNGNSFTLDWVSANVTSCDLSIRGGQDLGSVLINGSAGPFGPSHPFYPPAGGSNIFDITCLGLQSATATDSVTVLGPQTTPLPPPAPVISAATSPLCGGNIFISWNAVPGATSYKVFRSNVQVGTTTSPSFTDTGLTSNTLFSYTVKASNAVGDSPPSNSVSATSSGPCVGTTTAAVILTANPASITQGQSSTLSWTSANVTACSAPWTSSTATSSSQTVSPTSTTAYIITCSGLFGSASSTATVTVTPIIVVGTTTPAVTLTANPASITQGQNSTLSWTSANITSCSAPWTTATSTSGSQIVSPATTTAYTIACTGQFGTASSTATVTLTNGLGGGTTTTAVILTANPTVIIAGATSTLTWLSSNATACSAPWTSSTATSSSQTVSPTSTTVYTITCTGISGSSQASTTVTVNLSIGSCSAIAINSSLAVGSIIGTSFSYTLTATTTSTSSISYTITAASLPAGLSVSGNTISGIPTQGGAFTVAISATNGCATDTENLIISISSSGSGGSTGGGPGPSSGSGGQPYPGSGNGGGSSSGSVLAASTNCDYLNDYLHIGWANNPTEVIKLQVFLRDLEGFKNLPVSGIFDQATYNAVSAFQDQNKSDILTPWGYDSHTGYVYILTKKKINEIVCNEEFPLNAQQQQEITTFRAFMESLKKQGFVDASPQGQINNSGVSINVLYPPGSGGLLSKNSQYLTSESAPTSSEDDVGMISATSTTKPITDNTKNQSIAAAIFAGPQGLNQTLNAIVIFLLIIFVLYLLVRAVVDRQNKDNILTLETLRTRKILFFIFGLVVAVAACFAFRFYVIILPLLVLIIFFSAFLLWRLLNKKDEGVLVNVEDISKRNA